MSKKSMPPRLLTVKPQKNYHLLLQFDNGEWKDFDVSPYLDKGIFKELKAMELFFSATVVDGTVQWQNEADFCPDTLYLEGILIEKAARTTNHPYQ